MFYSIEVKQIMVGLKNCKLVDSRESIECMMAEFGGRRES